MLARALADPFASVRAVLRSRRSVNSGAPAETAARGSFAANERKDEPPEEGPCFAAPAPSVNREESELAEERPATALADLLRATLPDSELSSEGWQLLAQLRDCESATCALSHRHRPETRARVVSEVRSELRRVLALGETRRASNLAPCVVFFGSGLLFSEATALCAALSEAPRGARLHVVLHDSAYAEWLTRAGALAHDKATSALRPVPASALPTEAMCARADAASSLGGRGVRVRGERVDIASLNADKVEEIETATMLRVNEALCAVAAVGFTAAEASGVELTLTVTASETEASAAAGRAAELCVAIDVNSDAGVAWEAFVRCILAPGGRALGFLPRRGLTRRVALWRSESDASKEKRASS